MGAPFGFTGYVGGGPVPDVQMPDGLPVTGGKGSPLVDAYLALQGQRIKDAVTAPRDAYTGDLQVFGPDGHPSVAAMDRANGMAGLAMTGSMPFSAPAGSLRMFGGKSAATADHVALKEAQWLHNAGADRDHIWDATGWFKAPDGNWKFEIPDELSTIGTPKNAPPGFGQLHHDDLAQAYPGLWQNTGQSIREAPVASGRYDALADVVHAQGPTDAAQRSVALHEMQHAVQREEGFARGDSPANHGASAWEAAGRPMLSDAPDAASAQAAWARDQYHRSAGEVEARNVQARADMSPEQRFNTPPWLTQDVPDAEQIIKLFSGGPTGGAVGLPALASSSDPKGPSVSAGSPFGSLALPLPPGVSLEEVLGSLSPQQRAALGGSPAAPAQPQAAPPSLLGAQPPQMPEPTATSAPALPSLVGQSTPAMPQGPAPAAPRIPAPAEEDDKPTTGSLPAPARAPLSLAPPTAPAAAASPAVSVAAEPSFGDRFADGLKKNSDLLIGLGTGLMSTRGIGNGLAAGLQYAQKGEKDRAVTDLAKAEFGLKQQKAAQEQRQLTGNAQYVMGKIPGISADQALTLGSNSTFMNELFKGVLPPSELFKQFADKDGNIWSQNSRTGQATVALKADEDKTQRPLTDPAERARYGIAADDAKPYQVDANNKVSAIGGGGTSVSVDLGKKAAGEADAQILKKIDTSYDKAQGALGTLSAIGRQKQAIDRGMISGWGADWQTQARAMAGKLLGLSDDDVTNSQAFEGAAASKSAELAKAISQAGHTTNMDLQLGKTIAGGDRSKTEAAIRQIIDAQELLAKDTIAHHNSGVDKYVGTSPEMKDRMGWYHVETPEVYRYGQSAANPVADPGSAPAPATRMLNGRTYSRGPDGHWYEGR